MPTDRPLPTPRRAVLLSLIAAIGCSGSTGTQGPAGPTGPTGPQGVQGEIGPQGTAGTSVTALSLGLGDPSCPSGGSEFVSGASVTHACNGAPGPIGPTGPTGAVGLTGPMGLTGPAGPVGPIGPTGPQGPASPTIVWVDRAGNVAGPVLTGAGGAGASYHYVDGTGYVWILDPQTATCRDLAQLNTYYASTDCTGPAYFQGQLLPRMPFRLSDSATLYWVIPDAGVTPTTIAGGSGLSTAGSCYSYPYAVTGAIAKGDLRPAPAPAPIPGIVGGPLHVERR